MNPNHKSSMPTRAISKISLSAAPKSALSLSTSGLRGAACKTLGPIIEEVVTSLGPGIALAKVNVDENQQLAMAFRVQGIPAVKIIHQGKLVQEFTGAVPTEQIEAILRPLVPSAPEPDIEPAEQAAQRAAMGDLDGAAMIYKSILEEKPDDGDALLGLARIGLKRGHIDGVHEFVNLIEQGTPQYPAGPSPAGAD